ncbi:MAG: T9SS type A sorting domain-containing protein [Flavobacteriaceae bacterium]|nr:T9SS type A sorting domain-containing protein [Flavobacteriaceae bacterium]
MDVTIELGEDGTAVIDPADLLATMPGTFEVISISSDNQSGAVGNTDLTVPVTAADNITFDWMYNTSDGPAFDSFGYLLNGVFTEVIDPGGANTQMGTTGPIAVAPGDVFGFRSSSTDGLFGPSTTVVSNFIPGFTGQFEPANWTLTLDNSDGDAFFVEIPGGPLSFDACGITILAADVTEVTCDDIGTPITVTVFASDSSLNIAVCQSEVTVVDLLGPVVTCPADQTVDPGVGNLFWEVEDYFALGLATAIDNCTDPVTILSQDPAPGTLLSDGVYTITMTAEDEYGNIGTCTFELTVESVLGVDENTIDISTIIMYPNPARDVVNISNPQSIALEQAAIYDATGRLVQTYDLTDMGTEKALDISILSTATYLVVIQGADAYITKQLIKE